MAYQSYRHKTDRTVGTNAGTSKPTHPARPELQVRPGGENKTPAPVAAPTTTADVARSTSWGRSSGANGDNPGKNGFGGPSSLNPGEKAARATVDPQSPVDAVLDGLVRDGVRGLDSQDNWQTRDLTNPHDNPKGWVPNHPNMVAGRAPDDGSPGGTVPAKLGNPTSDWDARMAQRQKPGT